MTFANYFIFFSSVLLKSRKMPTRAISKPKKNLFFTYRHRWSRRAKSKTLIKCISNNSPLIVTTSVCKHNECITHLYALCQPRYADRINTINGGNKHNNNFFLSIFIITNEQYATAAYRNEDVIGPTVVCVVCALILSRRGWWKDVTRIWQIFWH